MQRVPFECQECGCTFLVYPSRAKANPKFCGVECKFKNIKTRETEKRKLTKCAICSKEFLLYDCRVKAANNNFCSMECHDLFRSRKVEKNCENCGKTYEVKSSREQKQNPRYCSMECRDIAFKGTNSPLYTSVKRSCSKCGKLFNAKKSEIEKGSGIYCSKSCQYSDMQLERPDDSLHFYTSPLWRKLSKACFERDAGSCQRCGKTEGILHAHHVVPRRIGGEDKLENLITLCHSCHATVDQELIKKERISRRKL